GHHFLLVQLDVDPIDGFAHEQGSHALAGRPDAATHLVDLAAVLAETLERKRVVAHHHWIAGCDESDRAGGNEQLRTQATLRAYVRDRGIARNGFAPCDEKGDDTRGGRTQFAHHIVLLDERSEFDLLALELGDLLRQLDLNRRLITARVREIAFDRGALAPQVLQLALLLEQVTLF